MWYIHDEQMEKTIQMNNSKDLYFCYDGLSLNLKFGCDKKLVDLYFKLGHAQNLQVSILEINDAKFKI